MKRTRNTATILMTLLTVLAWAASGFGVEIATSSASMTSSVPDSTLVRNLSADRVAPDRMALDRTAEGGVLRSLTIEGDDQVRIRFDRPDITLDLQPRSAPGLGWENAWDKLDLFPVVKSFSALESSPFLGRPWLNSFATDDVVVFRPQTEQADNWRLTVVDSRGRTAVTYEGKGQPPATLSWNGQRDDGSPAWPGLVYTHVLETTDKAGNRRTYTGEGFELPPYRLMKKDGIRLVLAGEHFTRPGERRRTSDAPVSDLVRETASWLNQIEGIEREIEIQVTARTNGQARRLAQTVTRALEGRVIGHPERIVSTVTIVADAPDHGMIIIATK